MNSSASVLRDTIIDALREESVALAACVDYDIWSDCDTPRVFMGYAGFLGSRNRGRLPFFEVMTHSQNFINETGEGGTVKTSVMIRLHDTGRDHETVSNRMDAIMASGIAEIRANHLNNYTQLGDSVIDEIKPGPFGWMQEATLDFEHSYERDTFEVTE